MNEETIILLLEAAHKDANSKASHMSNSLAMLIQFARANGIEIDARRLWYLYQQIPNETEPEHIMHVQICLN